jgi:hypothetical protein
MLRRATPGTAITAFIASGAVGQTSRDLDGRRRPYGEQACGRVRWGSRAVGQQRSDAQAQEGNDEGQFQIFHDLHPLIWKLRVLNRRGAPPKLTLSAA